MDHRVVEPIFSSNEQNFIHDLIADAMNKRDRFVSIYFGESGISVDIHPIVNDESEE